MKKLILDYLARFEFWWAKRKYASERDFKFFLDVNEPDSFAVEIIRHFPKTIVEYRNITMGENGFLSFDVVVVSNPMLHNIDSDKFKKTTSDIMRTIIADSVKNAMGEVNENRAVDSIESDEQRVVSEEGASLHEVGVPKRKPRKKTVRGNKKLR